MTRPVTQGEEEARARLKRVLDEVAALTEKVELLASQSRASARMYPEERAQSYALARAHEDVAKRLRAILVAGGAAS